MKVSGIELYSKLLIPSSLSMLRSSKLEVLCNELREVRAMQKIFVSFPSDNLFFGNKTRKKTGTIC